MEIKFCRFLILIILPWLLNSCYVTKSVLRKDNQYIETFDSIMVNQNSNQVILIPHDKKNFYIISDQDKSIANLALWQNSTKIKFDTDYGPMIMSESDFEIPYFVLLTSDKITDEEQISSLKNFGFTELGISQLEKDRYTKNYSIKNCKRIKADEKIIQDYQEIAFDLPYQVTFIIIKEPLSDRIKTNAILPFAAIADVILLPITIPVWLVTKDDEKN